MDGKGSTAGPGKIRTSALKEAPMESIIGKILESSSLVKVKSNEHWCIRGDCRIVGDAFGDPIDDFEVDRIGDGGVVSFCIVDVDSSEGSVVVGGGLSSAFSFGMLVPSGSFVVVGFVSVVSAGVFLSATSVGSFLMGVSSACGFASSVASFFIVFGSEVASIGGVFNFSVSDIGDFFFTSIVSIGFVVGEVGLGVLTVGVPTVGASTLLPTSLPPMLPSDPAPKSSEESRRRLACCNAVTLEAISCSYGFSRCNDCLFPRL
jgi:hypothetical protein